MEKFAEKESFLTLKEHKKNFVNKPDCRLINPTKTQLGKNKQNHPGKAHHKNDSKFQNNGKQDKCDLH